MNRYKKFAGYITQLVVDAVLHPRAFLNCLRGGARAFGRNRLLQLFSGTKSDKGLPDHNYARVYDALLHARQKEVEAFCEIGLLRNPLHGGRNGEKSSKVHSDTPSLSVWSKYFPSAHIVGFDHKQFKQSSQKNITVLQGDQKYRSDLQKIVEVHPCYDVIIDDGLHASEHQQITFSYLFKHIKPGGIFFIEDLRSQLPEFEKSDIPKTLDLLRKLQVNNTWESPVANDEEREYIERNVAEVHFFDSLKYDTRESPVLKNDSLAAIIKK